MLYAIIILFSFAAVAGLVILKNWLTGDNTARLTIYGHGVLAAAGLILLVIHYFQTSTKGLQPSIILFVIAALVGFYMFLRDMKNKLNPVWLAIAHGLVGGVALLLIVLMVI